MSLMTELKKALLIDVVVCIGAGCEEIINNNEASKVAHLKSKHPSYYNLIQDSLTHNEVIDINKLYI